MTEVNFDTLPGPTHFYGGLSFGNVPSMENVGSYSNPKMAALQSLEKMKLLDRLGVKQAILPPHERPYLPLLEKLGYTGSPEAILKGVEKFDPWLLEQLGSSASMWAANSATISPSVDSIENRMQITPANLASNLHRFIEAEFYSRLFKVIFPNPIFFSHHDPLPPIRPFFDEGAANQMRFCKSHEGPGIECFIFGSRQGQTFPPLPSKFPARQSLEACSSIIRLHKLFNGHFLSLLQNPEAIDQGSFHNDLVATSNQNLLLIHEKALFDQDANLDYLKKMVSSVCDTELIIFEIKEEDLPLKEALSTYFFNVQIVTLADNTMNMIAPMECQNNSKAFALHKKILDDNNIPITEIHYIDLHQSMKNGGGPACLRLRVVCKESEQKEILQTVFYSARLHDRLTEFIHKHYPDKFRSEDLSNPILYNKQRLALEELTQILNLGKIYSFQK